MALPSLTEFETIQQQIEALQAQAQEVLARDRPAVIADIQRRILVFKITGAELGFGPALPEPAAPKPRKRNRTSKRPAKYRDPNGSGATWSGGPGPKPHWFTAAIEAGISAESMLIEGQHGAA